MIPSRADIQRELDRGTHIADYLEDLGLSEKDTAKILSDLGSYRGKNPPSANAAPREEPR